MKKLLIILTAFLFAGCLQHYIDKLPDEAPQQGTIEEFDVVVPSDFDWSTINRKDIEFSIKHNGSITNSLDGTVVELFDQDDELMDALTIYDGVVVFNLKIPRSITRLKVNVLAANISKEFSPEMDKIDINVPTISAAAFSKNDTDKDGIFDLFDAFPENPEKGISINASLTDNQLKSAQARSTSSATYTIFEDLWPSIGDYDFNDLVVKAEFSWDRGKSNYISEITAVISVENIGAGLGLGLGYELFESKGNNLIYLADIINGVSGSGTKDEEVRNGIIVFNKVQNIGTAELTFTVTLDDKQLKDFIFIPYLFRTDDVHHQVRPFGAPPTASQNMALFNTINDNSPSAWNFEEGNRFKYPLTENEAFYKTKENHPWGIEFISKSRFKPSQENKSIIKSYPQFKIWAESGGSADQTWYENPL